MKLSFLLWLAQILPQPTADPLCLATTVYLEARDQSELGQRAVAEVALRRQESGHWGGSLCGVKNMAAWEKAVRIAFEAQRDWRLPPGERREVVPGASHFAALSIASPAWGTAPRVATIGDHTFFRVQNLAPPAPPPPASL